MLAENMLRISRGFLMESETVQDTIYKFTPGNYCRAKRQKGKNMVDEMKTVSRLASLFPKILTLFSLNAKNASFLTTLFTTMIHLFHKNQFCLPTVHIIMNKKERN